jgi:adenosylcobinamide kinase/adenosylcobinamide-phosphate guanylyltransferase
MLSTLILGGARSGKSRFAERLAQRSGLERVYVASAEARDDEMAARIAQHRVQRGEGWTTVEAPLALAEAIGRESRADRVLLVDCLTLWLSNVMLAEPDVDAECAGLFAAIAAASGPLVIVSNEVGLSIVPDTPLGRRFRDAQGILNQRVAEVVPRVVFVAAGLPLALKGELP